MLQTLKPGKTKSYTYSIEAVTDAASLDALRALVAHLDVLRPERKFVMVFTEGWPLFRPDDTLSRSIEGQVPGADPVRVNPLSGGFAKQGDGDPRTGQAMTYEACERLRTMLAYSDHETVFRQLLQRANRANVSFYPVDARGLIVFDTPIELGVPPYADRAWLDCYYSAAAPMRDPPKPENLKAFFSPSCIMAVSPASLMLIAPASICWAISKASVSEANTAALNP